MLHFISVKYYKIFLEPQLLHCTMVPVKYNHRKMILFSRLVEVEQEHISDNNKKKSFYCSGISDEVNLKYHCSGISYKVNLKYHYCGISDKVNLKYHYSGISDKVNLKYYWRIWNTSDIPSISSEIPPNIRGYLSLEIAQKWYNIYYSIQVPIFSKLLSISAHQ